MTHIKGSNLTKFFGLETHKSNFFSSGDWASALTQKEVQNASHGFRFWWDWWSEMTCWQLIPLRGSLQSLRTIEPTIKHHRNRKTQLGMQAHLQASSSVYVTVQRDAQKLSNTVCSILLSVFFAHPPEAWKKKKKCWTVIPFSLQSSVCMERKRLPVGTQTNRSGYFSLTDRETDISTQGRKNNCYTGGRSSCCDNQSPESNRYCHLLYFAIDPDGRHADMQAVSCLDAEQGKNKIRGTCFLSKTEQKLNHADSVSSTKLEGKLALMSPTWQTYCNRLLSPRNYMCILLIYLPWIFVEIIITAFFFPPEWSGGTFGCGA